MAAEMMSGDLPVTSDADAMAKEKAREAALAAGGTMLTGGTNKRKAGEVRAPRRVASVASSELENPRAMLYFSCHADHGTIPRGRLEKLCRGWGHLTHRVS